MGGGNPEYPLFLMFLTELLTVAAQLGLISTVAARRGYRISVSGERDFLGTKLFSGIRNKIQEKRYKTHIV